MDFFPLLSPGSWQITEYDSETLSFNHICLSLLSYLKFSHSPVCHSFHSCFSLCHPSLYFSLSSSSHPVIFACPPVSPNMHWYPWQIHKNITEVENHRKMISEERWDGLRRHFTFTDWTAQRSGGGWQNDTFWKQQQKNKTVWHNGQSDKHMPRYNNVDRKTVCCQDGLFIYGFPSVPITQGIKPSTHALFSALFWCVFVCMATTAGIQ